MGKQVKKKALVFCDNKLFFNAIQTNLNWLQIEAYCFEVDISPENTNVHLESDDFDLIIVAISLPSGEPIVTLYNASQLKQIGQVPLLIISDREFEPQYNGRIFHLNFPFDAAELRYKIQEIV